MTAAKCHDAGNGPLDMDSTRDQGEAMLGAQADALTQETRRDVKRCLSINER